MSTLDIRSNHKVMPSDDAYMVPVVDRILTHAQVRPHRGFASGVVMPRSPGHRRTDVDAHTPRLATPEGWAQRDDLPCLNNWVLWDDDHHDDHEAGERLCGACPVRTECLASALRHEGPVGPHARWGIRGGFNPAQRAAIARSGVPCKRDPRHGVPRRDARGWCSSCARESKQRQRAAQKARDALRICSVDQSHGANRYGNGQCKGCKRADRLAYQARKRAQRTEHP